MQLSTILRLGVLLGLGLFLFSLNLNSTNAIAGSGSQTGVDPVPGSNQICDTYDCLTQPFVTQTTCVFTSSQPYKKCRFQLFTQCPMTAKDFKSYDCKGVDSKTMLVCSHQLQNSCAK